MRRHFAILKVDSEKAPGWALFLCKLGVGFKWDVKELSPCHMDQPPARVFFPRS